MGAIGNGGLRPARRWRTGASAAGVLAAALIAAPSQAQSAASEPLQNWFHDPFFQVDDRVPDCPLPAGPFITEPERLNQTHHRAEKGTTCWLSGACDRPNVYAYDADIAAAFRAAWARSAPALVATLWVTVQGRVVYLEGCADDPTAAPRLEAWTHALPNVQQAIANLRVDRRAAAPYRLR